MIKEDRRREGNQAILFMTWVKDQANAHFDELVIQWSHDLQTAHIFLVDESDHSNVLKNNTDTWFCSVNELLALPEWFKEELGEAWRVVVKRTLNSPNFKSVVKMSLSTKPLI